MHGSLLFQADLHAQSMSVLLGMCLLLCQAQPSAQYKVRVCVGMSQAELPAFCGLG